MHDDRKINVTSRIHEDQTINVASRVKNAPPPWQPYSNMRNLLTKFHEDQKINVASRVLTRKNAPPPGGHVFQPTRIILELVQDINGVYLLTKFHEDWTINVAFYRVLTRFYNSHIIYSHLRKNAPPLGGHIFQAKVTISELIQDIIGTNLLSKFHEDLKINVASRVLTRKNAPPPGGHFYDDSTINVAYRVHIMKNAPPLGSHVFQANVTIFKLIQDIIETNLLTKFHEDWTINVASREKNAPPTCGHVFPATGTTFELVQNIIGTNLLTKFHDDRTINMASRVLARKNVTPPWRPYIIGTNHLIKFHDDRTINVASRVLTRKNAPPPGGHVFKETKTIFKLIQDIIRTNLLTKFHEDRKKMWPIEKNAPPPGSHMNLLTKFHEDRTINVASRVLTRFYYSHIRKIAPPLGSHVFQANVTILKLI
ncbi:hypothetical protein DPMN_041180 [Dreissena polymorpha]|uniref:Uncharacterized protein n=1 Tax=Dreissena polymorpha TaxID=45954 RepID=A0A9D4CYK3_DREPO|nr:hypothetical protein DPMN_041180 [Dreissena polymorpha]